MKHTKGNMLQTKMAHGPWDGCTRAHERHIGFRAEGKSEGNSSYYSITGNVTV